jgi:hypothetical protein
MRRKVWCYPLIHKKLSGPVIHNAMLAIICQGARRALPSPCGGNLYLGADTTTDLTILFVDNSFCSSHFGSMRLKPFCLAYLAGYVLSPIRRSHNGPKRKKPADDGGSQFQLSFIDNY